MPLNEQASAKVTRKRPSLWRRVAGGHPFRRGALLILLALVAEYLVLPQVGGVGRSLHLLGRVNIGFVVLGTGLEVASLASYAELTRTVLPRTTSTRTTS